ncbi:Hypothetical protein, putative [Bodo saltans]|uniref:NlpC/P60 domain-containing protein n=1 Tax=Bodo saltans TaxID=75058 RepID=A0A0S4JM25_BODSA|nr:Hypothetical protein, putative [Bodo saltans]|eukprot:CUG91243.1 Hypothetical protein, putative [Bodo saltans]
MKSLLVCALLAATLLASVIEARGCPSYESAVDICHNFTRIEKKDSRCRFWSCVVQFCDAEYVQATQHKYCRVPATAPRLKLPTSPLPRGVVARNTAKTVGTPATSSPCGGGQGSTDASTIRHWLLDTAMNVYYDRANEHYTEGNQRWSGITGHVCPPNAPEYSDCSSTVTWIYWTLFGNGNDFMNNESWSAGYTGTLDQHGTQVPINTTDLAIGDLCFYYTPMHHVAIYVGGGKVVSHGMDPVGYYPYDYAPVDFCRRYI